MRSTQPPPQSAADEQAEQFNFAGSFSWLLAMILALAAWTHLLFRPVSGVLLLGLLAIHAALAVSLERSLAAVPLTAGWRYRLAFLAGAGLSLARLLPISPVHIQPEPRGSILLAMLAGGVGAFLGSLFATGLAEPLWENNAPPSAAVQEEVYQRHLRWQPRPEPLAKLLFDRALAAAGLILSAPIWLLCMFIVWFEDPGPLFFIKNSVGKGGVNFHQLKFRTMMAGAESSTGPVMAEERDQRILLSGRFLRKTALDELPQLVNILWGEMSFVGPRPQRTILVLDYLKQIPEYAERHRVLPGLAGLAQVAGSYYLTPRQKLRLDRLYIRYMGLAFDIKLVALACLIAFWFRWQRGWSGRLPRRLIRLGSSPARPEPEPGLTAPPVS